MTARQRKMTASKQINYFRIGLFVMLGLFLIIFGIVILSSGKLLKKTIIVETYFGESIQGLSTGSPVKYQGVEIGHIDHISFVHQKYKQIHANANDAYNRYVYVEMIISPQIFVNETKTALKNIIAHDVADGLRVKLALQGLTGNAYLELNFTNPKENKPLAINWTPENYYIPSTPSTLTKFSDNAQEIIEKLRKINFQKLAENTSRMTGTSAKLMSHLNYLLSQTENQLKDTLKNSADISKNLRNFSEKIKNSPSQIIFSNPPPKLNPGNL